MACENRANAIRRSTGCRLCKRSLLPGRGVCNGQPNCVCRFCSDEGGAEGRMATWWVEGEPFVCTLGTCMHKVRNKVSALHKPTLWNCTRLTPSCVRACAYLCMVMPFRTRFVLLSLFGTMFIINVLDIALTHSVFFPSLLCCPVLIFLLASTH